ncbi:MAG: hypothetical protein HZB30_11275 [Nitrospirae bacterium]|nr:hypothetical protein [Nitrospirota bacterium]
MHTIYKRILVTVSAVLLTIGICGIAIAVELGDRVEVHGYGHQGYLQATGNKYLDADSSGTFNFTAVALVFTAKLTDKSNAWAQVHYTAQDGTIINWSVDYQFTNELKAIAGQLKQPLGFYNEIHDAKFLHFSTIAPLLYHDAAEMAFEAFRGVSAVYDQDFGASSLSVDGYFGGPVAMEEDADMSTTNKNLLGGRITYNTPVEGLKFMVAGYTVQVEQTDNSTMVEEKGHHNMTMISAGYAVNNLDLKAEYVRDKILENKRESYYIQAGYTIADKFLPFVRYDYITTDRTMKDDPSFYQKEIVIGSSYKLTNNIALRVENHFNRGYALPVASGEVDEGKGKKNWNMIATSVSFIF